MSDSAQPTVSQDVGQKNAVEIFLTAFERAIRSAKVYSYASGQEQLGSIFSNVMNALEKAFFEEEVIDIQVKPLQMLFQRKIVYDNKDKKHSLAFTLFENGIRMLSFRKGMPREELEKIIHIMSTDFSKSEVMDQDIYCLFSEEVFSHFEFVGADLLSEAQNNDPELKAQMESFISLVSQKFCEKNQAKPRKLRNDDLKVLEEFQLKPSQFSRSDEEVSRVVKSITATHSGNKKEKETLEKLAFMGFHFLVHDSEGSEPQVGRDLLTQVGVMILEQAYLDLFRSLIQKIFQLQKDQMQQTGEYQKILDGIFHPDHLDKFDTLLSDNDNDTKRTTCQILLNGPQSAVRIVVLLLGNHPWIARIFEDFVLKNLPPNMSWLLERVETDPQHPAWEQVLNIMAQKPTHHFSKFLTALLESAGESVRFKVLRQCARIGSKETLAVLQKMLDDKDEDARREAYEHLSGGKNKGSLQLLKNHIESARFGGFSAEEKEEAYRAMAVIGGKASYPWFEGMWFLPAKGLFKAKNQNERRFILFRALSKSQPEFIRSLYEKTPASELSTDLKTALDKVLGEQRT